MMTIDESNKLVDRAKTRKNGVYKFGLYYWAVKNGKYVGHVDLFGQIVSCHGWYVSDVKKVDKRNRKEELLQWLMSI